MTPKCRLVIALTGLITFTGLVITLLLLGQSAATISPLILVIVLGVQQLLQALDGGNRQNEGSGPTAVLPPTPTRSVESGAPSAAEGEQSDDTPQKAA